MNKIRNFAIISHIDHGKSTLADRLLELTGTIEKRKMRAQVLDRMDLERERGITIKLQPVRMNYQGYELNLIDTPGHVDFNYEVSRSLAAVEGALLLVDASQGIQAQTLANLYLAIEQDLTVIPVINKIDLPNAQIERTKKEIVHLLNCSEEEIILASAKTGQGVAEILSAVIEKVPEPKGEVGQSLRALIFDSVFDEYKGVIAYVRLMDGQIKTNEKISFVSSKKETEALEVGIFIPDYKATGGLSAGEIGYIATGLKEVKDCRVGDTIALAKSQVEPLQGYRQVKPMVFAGLFPKEGNNYQQLREAVEKLKLSDAAFTFDPGKSTALGLGFRCGFLGLLHLEIVQERLRREHQLELIITVPSVAYQLKKRGSVDAVFINNPEDLPDPSQIEKIEEPIMSVDIVSPADYQGGIMQLVQEKRGDYQNTEYLDEGRVILHYQMPLTALLVDFYDKLKSASSGYASLNYEFLKYRTCEVVKLDILVAEEKVEALASIVYKDEAYHVGKRIVESLKKTLPKQMFMVKIQAAIGGKIIAAERLSALRKDVTAKLYGGDVTRKRKLLEKQKKGKKKMMERGRVEIPTEAFISVLKK
ncbi:MAG: translation elongation factor 4 [bacterium]